MAVPSKTPVTILQELLCKRGAMPKYELVQIEGAIHEPTFRYRVTFGNLVASGTGRSKKEAKHAAARNILYKLAGDLMDEEEAAAASEAEELNLNPNPNPIPIPNQNLSLNLHLSLNQIRNMNPDMSRNRNHHNRSRQQSPNFDDKIPGNPIGTLQEMCMSKRWPPPAYEMIDEEGLPHERLFTIECSLLQYTEIGIGKSKKLAKRQAANKMWERLQAIYGNLPSSGAEAPRTRTAIQFTELNLDKVSIVASPKSPKVACFHTRLRRCTGQKLSLLHSGVLKIPGFDFVQFLRDLAFEQQFQLTFVDIDELSVTGLHQCLIQLSSYPIAVCYGCGESIQEARADAAENALEYLRVMTEKRNH